MKVAGGVRPARAPCHDVPMSDLLEALLRLIWWPYEASRRSGADSRIGLSELDRRNARFWKRLALAATIAIAIALLAVVALVFSRLH